MRDAPLALLCAALAASCSYDWTVGSPADGGDAASGADVTADTHGPIDASADAPGEASSDAATTDALEASLPTCNATQEGTVEQARAAALDCTGVTPMPCQVLLDDECGCPVYVAANNQAEGQYATAVQQLLMTCKPSWCATSCGAAPTKGLCILSDAGSGALACVD